MVAGDGKQDQGKSVTIDEAYLALNRVPLLGPVRLRKLLAVFESPLRLLSASSSELQKVEGIGLDVARSVTQWEKHADLEGELKRIRDFGASYVTLASPQYPQLLRDIHDPPIVLYMRGNLIPEDRHAVGIVGTRKPTHYAAGCAKKLGFQLAHSGITVVSGLARGVDTAAHQAAIAAKGRTIAVLGSGLQALYPPENQELAEKIAAGHGAVISEFPMETTADRQTFPMRNRIISGLSFGLLVIEAGGRSGALISASQAADQGRSVYAVPGRIDQPNALGSNRLIQQGAKLITSAQDILDDMGLLFAEKPELALAAQPVNLTETEEQIYASINEDETTIDEIISKCGLPTPEVSSTLLALEMRKLVKQLPGSRFVKLH